MMFPCTRRKMSSIAAVKALLITCLSLLTVACSGGSGSSGFDAKFAENAAIVRALGGENCVTPPAGRPRFCPADVNSPAGGPGTVEVGLDQTNLPCNSAGSAQCQIVLPFMPEGLPPTAMYRVAVRTVDPFGPWRIGAVPTASAPGVPDYDGSSSVDLPAPMTTPSSAESITVQVAVLVYLGTPPATAIEVETLAESGADFAYVTEERTLQVVR